MFPFTAELRRILEEQWRLADRLRREKGLIARYVFFHLVEMKDGTLGKKSGARITASGFDKAWRRARQKAGCPGRIPHDFRRTAVRNLEQAGVPRSVAMKLTGHKTEAVYRRYAIVSPGDLRTAARRLDAYTSAEGPDVSPQVIAMSSTISSAAQKAGMLVGDVIEAVEWREVTIESLVETINASPNRPLTLRIRRDGVRQDIMVTPQLGGGVGVIGVQLSPFEMRIVEPGPFEAFTMSLEQNYEWSGLIFRTIRDLLTRDTSPRQLVGPVGIAQMSGDAAQVGWVTLFGLMAMEGISRRDFSVRLKERMLLAGVVVLMTLMVTVIYNDLTRVEWIERLMVWR